MGVPGLSCHGTGVKHQKPDHHRPRNEHLSVFTDLSLAVLELNILFLAAGWDISMFAVQTVTLVQRCWKDGKWSLLEAPCYTNKIRLRAWVMGWIHFIYPPTVYKSSVQSKLYSKGWETGTTRAQFILPVWNTCLQWARTESPFQMDRYIYIRCVYTSFAGRQKSALPLLGLNLLWTT